MAYLRIASIVIILNRIELPHLAAGIETFVITFTRKKHHLDF